MKKKLTTPAYVVISMFLAVCDKTLGYSIAAKNWEFAYFDISSPDTFFEWMFLTIGIFAAISVATFLRKENDLKRLIAVSIVVGFVIIRTIHFGLMMFFFPESFWINNFFIAWQETYQSTAIISVLCTIIGWYKAKQEIKAEGKEE